MWSSIFNSPRNTVKRQDNQWVPCDRSDVPCLVMEMSARYVEDEFHIPLGGDEFQDALLQKMPELEDAMHRKCQETGSIFGGLRQEDKIVGVTFFGDMVFEIHIQQGRLKGND